MGIIPDPKGASPESSTQCRTFTPLVIASVTVQTPETSLVVQYLHRYVDLYVSRYIVNLGTLRCNALAEDILRAKSKRVGPRHHHHSHFGAYSVGSDPRFSLRDVYSKLSKRNFLQPPRSAT